MTTLILILFLAKIKGRAKNKLVTFYIKTLDLS